MAQNCFESPHSPECNGCPSAKGLYHLKISVSFKLILLVLFFIFPDVSAQRRERPGSLKNTNEYLDNVNKEEPITCKYIRSGASFSSNAYYSGDAGRIKMGTATLTLSGNHYTLSFKSAKVEMRDAEYKGKKHEYNPWRMEKIANDFIQSGKYETFKKNNKYYLRLYDGDSDNYIIDINLKSPDQKDFVMADDNMSFEFTYK